MSFSFLSSAVMATWFVTDSGTFICKDAIQKSLSLSYYSPNWWSHGHQIWAMLRTHHQIDSLFAIRYCGGCVGHTTSNTVTYSDVPFESQTHQISFQIGLVVPVLSINLEDYICYTFSLFLLYLWQWQMHHCCFE